MRVKYESQSINFYRRIFIKMMGLNSIFKLFHSIVVIYVTFLLYEINKTLPAAYVGIQILFTLLITLLEKKSIGRDWKQIFLSLSLVYALRSTDLNVLRFLFLGKIFYVQRSLAQVSDSLFVGGFKVFRLFKVVFDFARLTFVFYMVLGLFIVGYKYWAYLWTDPEKTLSTHQILYFFMITSSSIGYGDVTPKNQYQMYFLIAFIPILIISFGQYFGKAVGCFDQFIGILRQNSSSISNDSLLNKNLWGKQDLQNLTDYISHAQSKNASVQQQKQHFANNWLSLACKNYETHQPLLIQILDSEESKEYKLLVASRLKRFLYPSGWTIIQKGNLDKHIFMIEEGQVQAGKQILAAGRTFNLSGFSNDLPSTQSYITRSFTSVWAISVADLVQIGRNSINLQTKLNKKLTQIQASL